MYSILPARVASSFSLTTVLLLTITLAACSDEAGHSAELAREVTDAQGRSLGSIALTVTCADDAAVHIRRGTALLHNMTYTQAATTFEEAAALDPSCALAYWGQAMSYVHPLWPDVPTDERFVRGVALLAEARTTGRPSEHDEAYLAALDAYYRDWSVRDETERLAAYLDGWNQAFTAYPEDQELRLFRGLLLAAVATSSESRVEMQIEAGQIAEAVLEEIPDHTGALHYIIHAYDLPELADRALPAARVYGEMAKGNQHALHMTSHIFTRLGLWEESITYNRRAADEALKNPISGALSFHYSHAADYLAYAHIQRADEASARLIWEEMAAKDGPMHNHPANPYAYAAVPARIALESRDWEGATRLQARWPEGLQWDQYPQFEAITVFARGLGAARSGNLPSARAALTRLNALAPLADAVPIAYDWGGQVRIQARTVSAWIAHGEGDIDEAIRLMSEAREMEGATRKNPVTPGEVIPAAELLGDMLLAEDRFGEAMEAYESALVRSPNRLSGLFGAGLAAEGMGDAEAARAHYAQLISAMVQDSPSPRLSHAKAFLAGI
ncbi:MAG: tetratricopeptide (TPR) repeat protein [Rhodothermales bacterium]|jgi:tetratricopeptide (TPR) repeat protein